ncbi:MAG: hypothetical protein QF450_02155 [Rhodospirillales bacterium]|jgi:hypothetical protein|nr:hypothetical protein [Rhodospirillales bacterium]
MAKLNRQTIDDYVSAWHGIRLTASQAEAISAEANDYEELTRNVATQLKFEDEPSDFLLAIAGREDPGRRTR